eukprot:c5214_g1_i2.p1 GENE.c5214_g1_i2~~c5214_g1_i2.p1  ORF type:complete len:410 (-),score=87.48 c5214_g1_i2:114-1343(-)
MSSTPPTTKRTPTSRTQNTPTQDFALERYFAEFEFCTEHLLCCSDPESMTMTELVGMADPETKALWENLTLGYTESQGLPQLRDEIASMYEDMDAKNNVLVMCPGEGLFLYFHAMISPSDHVIVVDPCYQSLVETVRSKGASVTKWKGRCNPHTGEWRFEVKDLLNEVTSQTTLIVMNFPHNPTGATLTSIELEEVVDIARQRGIRIFSDEMYRLLEHDPADRLPSVCTLYDRATSLSGVSKTLGLAGLRIGWLVSRDTEALSRCIAFKDYTTICNPAPSEVLALIALRARDRLLERTLGIARQNVALLKEELPGLSKVIRWTVPRVGLIGFPCFDEQAAGMTVDELAVELSRSYSTLLLPGRVFDEEHLRGEREHNQYSSYFRFGFGRVGMAPALQQLKAFAKQQFDK